MSLSWWWWSRQNEGRSGYGERKEWNGWWGEKNNVPPRQPGESGWSCDLYNQTPLEVESRVVSKNSEMLRTDVTLHWNSNYCTCYKSTETFWLKEYYEKIILKKHNKVFGMILSLKTFHLTSIKVIWHFLEHLHILLNLFLYAQFQSALKYHYL